MNREEFEKYLLKTFNIKPEYPWVRYPSFAVFRHTDSKKWFAVIMSIDKSKLGLTGQGKIDVVNLKRDVNMPLPFGVESGIFPAYHMNKEHWITVLLDSIVTQENLKFLLSISYDLTLKK